MVLESIKRVTIEFRGVPVSIPARWCGECRAEFKFSEDDEHGPGCRGKRPHLHGRCGCRMVAFFISPTDDLQ
jgi:hypothetical protein